MVDTVSNDSNLAMVQTTAPPVDIVILSNGPGELVTWVKPTVYALRQALGDDRQQVRISVALSPCSNASGNEAAIASSYREVDRVQAAQDFWPFLLFGRTAANWDWRSRGVVLFLGGDQIFPVIIGQRLGYKTVIYSEWDARWTSWIDRFAVMNPHLAAQANPKHRSKFTVVGDLMAEVGNRATNEGDISGSTTPTERIGILPGSKRAKLMQGIPLMLATVERIHAMRPQAEFVIPVAPTLTLEELAHYAIAENNPAFDLVQGVRGQLCVGDRPYLETPQGAKVWLHQATGDQVPPYDLLKQCRLCLTTVGANTAELGALAVPMLVLLPTNQLDAMRAWDGLPGVLANLPGVGTLFAKLINQLALRKIGLLAWPNIWAGKQIVPELVGQLYPQEIADLTIEYLEHPEELAAMRAALQAARGEPGAATKLAAIVAELVHA